MSYQKNLITLALAVATGSAMAAGVADFSADAAGAPIQRELTIEQCQAKVQAVAKAYGDIPAYVDAELKAGRVSIDPFAKQFNSVQAATCLEHVKGRPLTPDEQMMVRDEYSGRFTPGWMTRAPLMGVAMDMMAKVANNGTCIDLDTAEYERQCLDARTGEPKDSATGKCRANFSAQVPTIQKSLGILDRTYRWPAAKGDLCQADAKRVLTGWVESIYNGYQQRALYNSLIKQ